MGQPVSVNVGHKVTCTYTFVDQNGNPMLVQPTPAAPATWTDTPSAAGVDSNSVSADGTTDVVSALAAGTDTVGLSVTIQTPAGTPQTFTDSALITVTPAPQVVSGVVIETAVS